MIPIISTSATNGAVTVGSTTTVLLAANSGRLQIELTNNSNEDIYLGFGAAAVMNQGIKLEADIGTYSFPPGFVFTGAINAICTSGSKSLTYVEFKK